MVLLLPFSLTLWIAVQRCCPVFNAIWRENSLSSDHVVPLYEKYSTTVRTFIKIFKYECKYMFINNCILGLISLKRRYLYTTYCFYRKHISKQKDFFFNLDLVCLSVRLFVCMYALIICHNSIKILLLTHFVRKNKVKSTTGKKACTFISNFPLIN